jgi:hypothetical protein
MAGFTHYLRFQADRHYIRAGYQFDWEAAEGSNWDYLGHRALLGAQYTLPWWDLRLRYDFDVHFRDYRNRNTLQPTLSPDTIHRIDRDMNHQVSLSKDLPYNMTVSLEYLFNRNYSNLAIYNYARNVVSLSLSWRY